MEKIGLVLTGGGARAAYQAGALKAISEICEFKENPFKIISGISAGSINGIWIAGQSSQFEVTTQSLWDNWATIEMNQVFKTDPATVFSIGARWVRNLSLGGWLHQPNINYLLDTSPLKAYIKSKMNLKSIQLNIADKKIHAIAITATQYHSGLSVTYFDGHASITPWSREGRESRRCVLQTAHLLASAAIPIFFPPVKLEDGFYGDGGIKLSSPLSPAIHMGADRILAIGIHHKQDAKRTSHHISSKSISTGDIIGTLLNALFSHSIDADLERLNRINRTLAILSNEQLKKEPDQLRHIPTLAIRPSQDLGLMTSELFSRFPQTIKYLLRGLGASDLESWDLMSYLAFEKEYILSLLKLGYQDAFAQKRDILQFFKT